MDEQPWPLRILKTVRVKVAFGRDILLQEALVLELNNPDHTHLKYICWTRVGPAQSVDRTDQVNGIEWLRATSDAFLKVKHAL